MRMPRKSKENQDPSPLAEPEKPYTRQDFLGDLRKASRKLEPEEKAPKRKRRPSGRSPGKA
jgi:hypothetical protein